MIPTPRHTPAWRRRGPIELRMLRLRDAIAAERSGWRRSDPIYLALGRAERALETAGRLCRADEAA